MSDRQDRGINNSQQDKAIFACNPDWERARRRVGVEIGGALTFGGPRSSCSPQCQTIDLNGFLERISKSGNQFSECAQAGCSTKAESLNSSNFLFCRTLVASRPPLAPDAKPVTTFAERAPAF